MPRARIKAEKAMCVLLPYQRFPSGGAITSGQREEIDAAWVPLTECAAPVPNTPHDFDLGNPSCYPFP